jgi:CRP-like cAMP-binding protein
MQKRLKVSEVNRVVIFAELEKEQMDLLRPLFEPFSCSAGTVIFRQGAPADYLYFVLSGKVEVFYKPHDGNPMTVSHVEQGGLFGWSAVVGSEKYTSSTIAIQDLETYRIQGNQLRNLCAEHPEAGQDILERLAKGVSSRWNNAYEQVKAILHQGMHN